MNDFVGNGFMQVIIVEPILMKFVESGLIICNFQTSLPFNLSYHIYRYKIFHNIV